MEQLKDFAWLEIISMFAFNVYNMYIDLKLIQHLWWCARTTLMKGMFVWVEIDHVSKREVCIHAHQAMHCMIIYLTHPTLAQQVYLLWLIYSFLFYDLQLPTVSMVFMRTKEISKSYRGSANIHNKFSRLHYLYGVYEFSARPKFVRFEPSQIELKPVKEAQA